MLQIRAINDDLFPFRKLMIEITRNMEKIEARSFDIWKFTVPRKFTVKCWQLMEEMVHYITLLFDGKEFSN